MGELPGAEVVGGWLALLVVQTFETTDDVTRTVVEALRDEIVAQLAEDDREALRALALDAVTADGFEVVVARLGEMLADVPLCERLVAMLVRAEGPEVAGAQLVLARHADALRSLGRLDEALSLYDKALRRDPDDGSALCCSAAALCQRGRAGDADEARDRLLQVAAQDDKDAEDHALLARAFLELGDQEAARSAVDGAVTALATGATGEPLSPEQRLDLGDVCADLGQADRTVEVLGPLLAGEGPPSETELAAHLLAARVLIMQLGEGDRAETVLRDLGARVGSFDDHPLARGLMGQALNLQGRHADALAWLTAGLIDDLSDTTQAWVMAQRGIALVATGDAEQAEPLLAAAVDRLGPDLDADLVLGMARFRLGRLDEARAAFEVAATLVDEADHEARGYIAVWMAIVSGDENRYRAHLDEADELLAPESPHRPLWSMLEAKAVLGNDPAKALALVDGIEAPPPAWRTDMTIVRARALQSLDRPREALDTVTAMLDDPDPVAVPSTERPQLEWTLADLLALADRPREALDALLGIRDAALGEDGLAMAYPRDPRSGSADLGPLGAARGRQNEDGPESVVTARLWSTRGGVVVVVGCGRVVVGRSMGSPPSPGGGGPTGAPR